MGFSTPLSRISWIFLFSASVSLTLPAELPLTEPPHSYPASSLWCFLALSATRCA